MIPHLFGVWRIAFDITNAAQFGQDLVARRQAEMIDPVEHSSAGFGEHPLRKAGRERRYLEAFVQQPMHKSCRLGLGRPGMSCQSRQLIGGRRGMQGRGHHSNSISDNDPRLTEF